MKREMMTWAIILTACAIIISIPLFSSQVIWGPDLLFHLNRIEGVKEGLLAGQFPVRIHPFQIYGYGVPVGMFYPDLFLYIPAVFRIVGVPLELAYNIFLIILNIMTVYLTWYGYALLGKSIRIGAVSATLYISFWYIFINLYRRAALGETLAMVFFPLAVAMTLYILYDDAHKWPLAVFAYSGIIQSHILSSLFLLVVILTINIISWKQLLDASRRLAVLKIILFTFLINAWFIVPFIIFNQTMDINIKSNVSIFHEFDIDIISLLIIQLTWGILTFVSSILFLWLRFKTTLVGTVQMKRIAIYMFSGAIFCMYMATGSFPWRVIEAIPIINKVAIVQLPIRFMEVASIGLSFCGALAITTIFERVPHRGKIFLLSTFCISICMFNLFLFTYSSFQDMHLPYMHITVNELQSRDYNGRTDYLYKGMDAKDIDECNKTFVINNEYRNITVYSFLKNGTLILFSYQAEKKSTVTLPMFYYPGYEVKINNDMAVPIGENNRHLLTIDLPCGYNTVLVKYVGLPLFQLADFVSIISIIVFLLFSFKYNFP